MKRASAFDESERMKWADRADAYAAGFGKLCAHTVPDLFAAAKVAAGDRLLDVGTGTGAVAEVACDAGAIVTAVDPEPTMVRRTAGAVPAAEVRIGSLPDLPFADDEFDATVANFVVNHVSSPLAAVRELRRVTRPDGRIAVTIWTHPPADGQALLAHAVEAAGVKRPEGVPVLSAEEDFPRSTEGLAGLLCSGGLANVSSSTIAWDHFTTRDEWWNAAAAGVATIGQILASQSAETIARIRRHYDHLAEQFAGANGDLALPHAAHLAQGSA
jgi:SAM-dependent methyltransferase